MRQFVFQIANYHYDTGFALENSVIDVDFRSGNEYLFINLLSG